MSDTCTACGAELGDGRFCPGCGVERPAADAGDDPFIGKVIGERFEIQELISEGGMGKVYRGVQRVLDRPVAVKFVHPHLLVADDIVARFLVEAQTASKISHPNVISIYDFGRMPQADGGHFYLVMEFLKGPDLGTILESGDKIGFSRACDILCQALAGLQEAHHHGIVHRDVKPENLLIVKKRNGGEQVKLIDFGIARASQGRRVTRIGQVVGTPHYMSPEQVKGSDVGPSADLYAIGVILFQILTGRVPFEGASSQAILQKQISAPRKDPRVVAPHRAIPDGLAEVCLRAIDLDPSKRYETAEELTAAIRAATRSASLGARAEGARADAGPSAVSPPPPSPKIEVRPSPPAGERALAQRALADTLEAQRRGGVPATSEPARPMRRSLARRAVVRVTRTEPDDTGQPRVHIAKKRSTRGTRAKPSTPPVRPAPAHAPPPPPPAFDPPLPDRDVRPFAEVPELTGWSPDLVGRSGEIAWARELLGGRGDASTMLVTGRSGLGRTRLAHEIMHMAAALGVSVVACAAPPLPLSELGYGTLRTLIARLLGLEESNPRLAPPGNAAFRAIFADDSPPPPTPSVARERAAAALRWALSAAVRAARRKRVSSPGTSTPAVLVTIDDVDRIDGASRLALLDLISAGVPAGALVLMTAESRPIGLPEPGVESRALAGLHTDDVAVLAAGEKRPPLFTREDEDIAPLYVEHLLRWNAEEAVHHVAPPRLPDLLEWRIRNHTISQRQTLQAVAALGRATRQTLTFVVPMPDTIDAAIPVLERAGFLEVNGAEVAVPHRIIAEVALGVGPATAPAKLHEQAAGALLAAPAKIELLSYHACRSHPLDESFLFYVDRCAKRRAELGDRAGVLSALRDGYMGSKAARDLSTARSSSGMNLAQRLAEEGLIEEAETVLRELAADESLSGEERGASLGELAKIAASRGDGGAVAKARKEALGLALATGDEGLLARVSALFAAAKEGVKKA